MISKSRQQREENNLLETTAAMNMILSSRIHKASDTPVITKINAMIKIREDTQIPFWVLETSYEVMLE